MSKVVELIPAAVDHRLIPVVIAPTVQMVPFLRALDAVGLTYRHDVARKVIIIEPLQAVTALASPGPHDPARSPAQRLGGLPHSTTGGHAQIETRASTRNLRRFAAARIRARTGLPLPPNEGVQL